MNKKIFLTFFPKCEELHLTKDVGLIPYMFQKNYDVKSIIVCNKNLNHCKTNKSLKLLFKNIPKYTFSDTINEILFIIKNARKIDYLNLYHFSKRACFWGIIYKKINPKGKVYLKLDLDFRSLNIYTQEVFFKRVFRKFCIKHFDLVSVESRCIKEKLNLLWGTQKIKYVPDGILIPKNFNCKNIKKNNYLLTVGRLGTEQKATEVLLEAFRLLSSKTGVDQWKLLLVGSMEKSFENLYYKFLSENFLLAQNIHYLGEIHDKTELEKIYTMSKIFVLPSRWESFGIVLPEAQLFGCKIVTTTGVPSAKDLIPDDSFGTIVPCDNAEKMAEALFNLIQSTEIQNQNIEAITDFVSQNYDWNIICNKIKNYLEGKYYDKIS